MTELDQSTGARLARRRRRLDLGVALFGVTALVAGSIVVLELQVGAVPSPPVVVAPAARVAAAHPPFVALADVPRLTPPAFEFAGIGPDHNAVASGTGEPNAIVGIRDGAAEIGQVRADAQGRWTFTGAAALAPGGHELALVEHRADAPSDRPETLGVEPMMLVVETPEAPPPAFASLAEADPPGPLPLAALPLMPPLTPAPPQAPLLTMPARVPAKTPIRARRTPLLIETASYNVLGAPHLSGRAADGAPLVVMVDGHKAGRASANGSGRWSVALEQRVKAGRHHVRVEEIAASGQILAAVEKPLIRD